MFSTPTKLILEIPQQVNSYKLLIEQCCDFISDIKHFSEDFSKTSKFKLVIMELLTNAMKHCNAISYLEIHILQNQLVIRKVDCGRKFSFLDNDSKENYQFPIATFKEPVLINALLGNNYKLSLLIKSENHIEFLEPPEIDYLSFQEIPENFGLMIIKKCADVFQYYYDEKTFSNIFEVIFKFQEDK